MELAGVGVMENVRVKGRRQRSRTGEIVPSRGLFFPVQEVRKYLIPMQDLWPLRVPIRKWFRNIFGSSAVSAAITTSRAC